MGTYGYIKHSELSHHGIKGQRWGVRNGPPYPLSESDRSTKERKLNPTSKIIGAAKETSKFITTHASGKNKYARNNIANIFKGTPENAAMKNTPGGKQWIANKEVGKAYAKEFAGKGTYKAISKEVGKGAKEYVKAVPKALPKEFAGKGNLKATSTEAGKFAAKDITRAMAGNKVIGKASDRVKAKKSLKNIDILVNHEKDPKRSDKAAILGLRALEGPNADLSKRNKEWFLYEDQTIGFPEVADLVNQGYNKKDILSIINTKRDEYWSNDDHSPESFGFGEGYGLEEFLDKCIEVKNQRKK